MLGWYGVRTKSLESLRSALNGIFISFTKINLSPKNKTHNQKKKKNRKRKIEKKKKRTKRNVG